MSTQEPVPFVEARDSTLYWTLSLHVPAARLWRQGIDSAETGSRPLDIRFDRNVIAALQMREPVSCALGQAIEPLFNDIADREDMGRRSDYLLAVEPEPCDGSADACARRAERIVFQPPEQVSWSTEGKTYVAAPDGLDRPREARLRRFWFVHPDGGLSWHFAVSVGFEHDPADYLFLSMLQKIAAPKEFTLPDAAYRSGGPSGQPPAISVLDAADLGIPPLDRMLLAMPERPGFVARRVWHVLKALFDEDAASLVGRLRAAHGLGPLTGPLPELLQPEPIIEVPGLLMPRCRSLMYFHDKRFFERVSAKFDDNGNLIDRRKLVQDGCYLPYALRLRQEVEEAGEGVIRLADGAGSYWQWVRERPEYAGLSDDQVDQIRAGDFVDPAGHRYHIPTFERRRSDCLEFMFLAGFNQNIIDFMNQDPSEILDGTDPIYPATEEQAREGFFVRFANHRSIITYASKSRSLEVGNDYISNCPYAFLLHVLSLHNEFLARDFGSGAMNELARIEQELETPAGMGALKAIGRRINALKIARYRDYEQYRYVNVFRYDTERDVFAELDRLRGVNRKDKALELAIASLEDHADDLDAFRSAERDRNIAAIGFVFGLLVIANGLGEIGKFAAARVQGAWGKWLANVLDTAATGITLIVLAVAALLLITRWTEIRELFEPARRLSPRADRQSSVDR